MSRLKPDPKEYIQKKKEDFRFTPEDPATVKDICVSIVCADCHKAFSPDLKLHPLNAYLNFEQDSSKGTAIISFLCKKHYMIRKDKKEKWIEEMKTGYLKEIEWAKTEENKERAEMLLKYRDF